MVNTVFGKDLGMSTRYGPGSYVSTVNHMWRLVTRRVCREGSSHREQYTLGRVTVISASLILGRVVQTVSPTLRGGLRNANYARKLF